MNGGFDFSKAVVDPWAVTQPGVRFFVVLARRKSVGEAFQALGSGMFASDVAHDILKNLPVMFLADLKDVRIIEISEMELLDHEEVTTKLAEELSNEVS